MKTETMITIFITLFVMVTWGVNVYKLADSDFECPYKSEIIRSLGIISPIFLVTAFMDIGDE